MIPCQDCLHFIRGECTYPSITNEIPCPHAVARTFENFYHDFNNANQFSGYTKLPITYQGYDIYVLAMRLDGGEYTLTGLPLYILANEDEIRLATQRETFSISTKI